MTKEEKRQAEASKPLEERSYWHLSKTEKIQWCDKRGVRKSEDITIPILVPLLGIAFMIFGLIMIILVLNAKDGTLFATNRGLWAAACGVCAAIGLGVAIWLFVDMAKKKKGFFINQYYSGNRSSVDRMHEEADAERATKENQPTSASLDDLDELDL